MEKVIEITELKNITVKLEGLKVSVSISIKGNLGFVGPNGAGKSTNHQNDYGIDQNCRFNKNIWKKS